MTDVQVYKQAEALELPHRNDAYEYQVKTFRNWMQERGETDPLSCVADYFADLNQSNYSANTIRMKRQAVKNRLSLMADLSCFNMEQQFHFDRLMQRLDTDQATKAPKIANRTVGASKVLTDAEYTKLLDQARSERQRLFIEFLTFTACRVSELCGAQIRNCQTTGNTTHIRIRGKGNKERTLRIPTDLYSRIRAVFNGGVYLFETTKGKPYPRTYVSDQIGKLTLHVIGRRLSAHKMRHTRLTNLVHKYPGNLKAIADLAGHSSVTTLMNNYVHGELTDSELGIV